MKTRSPTYIARRKPVELLARPVTEECQVETWEGARTAHVGDYIMTGVQGEHWPVPGWQFDELYEILGPSPQHKDLLRVRKRIREVPVYQTYEAFQYVLRGEKFRVGPGYFIISYGEEDRFPCESSVFFQTFEIIRPAKPEEEFDVRPL